MCRLMLEVEYGVSLEVVDSSGKGVDAINTGIENNHNEPVKKTKEHAYPVKNQSYGRRELASELRGDIDLFADCYRISMSENF